MVLLAASVIVVASKDGFLEVGDRTEKPNSFKLMQLLNSITDSLD